MSGLNLTLVIFSSFLDVAIQKDYAKNISLYITTNASKFNDKIIKKVMQFKKVYFTVSCDGYEGTYDYTFPVEPFNYRESDKVLFDLENSVLISFL